MESKSNDDAKNESAQQEAKENFENNDNDHMMEVGSEYDEPINYDVKPKFHDFTSYFTTDKVFASREDLINWCQKIGKTVITVVIIQRSQRMTPTRKARLVFGCERSGPYRPFKNKKSVHDKAHRDTGSKKCQCPFLLNGIPLANDKWKVQVQCGKHNHELGDTLVGHSYIGRLNKEEVEYVKYMSKSGVRPKMILHNLREMNHDNRTCRKTLYNVITSLRLTELQGMTCMQYTLTKLKENNYVYFVRQNDELNEVTQIFWCHPDSLQLLRCFPNVLIVDCTYKTNKYKMPLFEIVGVTSTWQTFSVGFVFMSNEKEDNYIWALQMLSTIMESNRQPQVFVTDKEQALINAISSVFPNATRLLCKWHVCKNITTNCKKEFEVGDEWKRFLEDWRFLIDIKEEGKFDEKLADFEKVWRTHPKAVSYVKKNWIPLKEYYVSAWTNRILHFGNETTQRVESAHAILKEHLKSSTGSFAEVWTAMERMISLQILEIDEAFQKSKLKPRHDHVADPTLRQLIGNISLHGLTLIHKEKQRGLEYVDINLGNCGCVFRTSYGLPCAHELIKYHRERKSVPLSCIHQNWKILSRVNCDNEATGLNLSNNIVLGLNNVWKVYTPEDKRALKRKVDDILSPCSVLINEPKQNTRIKGRPKGSKNNKSNSSTKRDPSGFEYAQTIEEKNLSMAKLNKRKKLPLKRGKEISGIDVRLLEHIPMFIHPFIDKLSDVSGDGHCGFHVCALGLELQDLDAWQKVRLDLIAELDLNRSLYEKIWGKPEVTRQELKLNCLSPVAHEDHWMEQPVHGMLAANWYNRVLIMISKKGCSTFVPFFTNPTIGFEEKIFGWAYLVDLKHYVYVKFKPGTPLPPIVPEWKHHRTPNAQNWVNPLRLRLEYWRIRKPPLVPVNDNSITTLK